MDIKEIMKLIQGVSDYGLTSFELEEGNMKISLKREKETIQVQTPVLTAAIPAYGSGAAGALTGVVPGAPAVAGTGLEGGLMVQAADGSGSNAGAAGAADGQAAGIASDLVVTSPLVGVFYAAASPDSDAFVKVGDRVKKGQVLGIIEAMKLMNEIESEYDGVVEAILVKNEDVVEYGQPLFRIR